MEGPEHPWDNVNINHNCVACVCVCARMTSLMCMRMCESYESGDGVQESADTHRQSSQKTHT